MIKSELALMLASWGDKQSTWLLIIAPLGRSETMIINPLAGGSLN